jgi:DNA-binding NarL/FixJ family response regulator
VAGGQGWLSPLAALVATSVLRETVVVVPAADRQRQAQLRFGLTRREREVMELLSQGLSNASIAGRLQLTEKTVKNHLNRILGKMRVHNRTEAVVRWTRT